MLDYSHALMSLMDQIVEQVKPKCQIDLRDQFSEGVRDQSLSIRLRDKVCLNPQWAIRNARREAIQWTTQCDGQSFKQKDITLHFFPMKSRHKHPVSQLTINNLILN